MLVQCPSCSARYKVNDANIPPTGGKIRCPKCSHTFVVYPEASEPVDATQIASVGGGYDDAATSIADIASLMQRPPGGGPAQHEEEDGATEIMSGDSIPDFSSMFNGGSPPIPEDGTVEMQNPLELLQKAGWNQPEEEDGATEIVSADMVFGNGAPAGGNPFGNAPSAPPVATPEPAPRAQSTTQYGGWQAQDVTAAAEAQRQQQAAAEAQRQQQAAANPPPQVGGFGGGDPFADVDTGAPAAAGAAGPNPNHHGPWKLKTSFGLTYEFQDTKSLLGWMSSRDDLSGYTLSEGTEQFYPIEQFPQVMGQLSGAGARSLSGSMSAVAPSGPQAPVAPAGGGFGGAPVGNAPAGGGFGGGQGGFNGGQGGFGGQMGGAAAPTTPRQPGEKISNGEFGSPSKGKGKGLTALLLTLFVVFGLVVVVLSLHIFKVIDIKAMVSGEPTPAVVQPETTEPEVVEEVPEETPEPKGLDEETKREVDQMISDARDAVENKKLMSARAKLETAKALDPNRFEVYDLLAKVYEQTGQEDKAAEVRAEVKALRESVGSTP